jgi:cytochrome c oxidase subunit 2
VLGAAALAAAACVLAIPAYADAPLTYLRSQGRQADTILPLTWALAGVSVLVVIIIAAVVLIGAWRRRQVVNPSPEAMPRLERSGPGLNWIAIGTLLTILPLIGAMAWTVVSLADVQAPPSEPKLTIEIRGHQWWWEVRYIGDQPDRSFETANEIHIPAGEPVRFKLTTADVIHSFWVPALGGKTDMIPGQTNYSWLEANAPGVYRGQCQEYCGQQHAHMALEVIADDPDRFQQWWDHQLAAAPAPADGADQEGRDDFVVRCGGCHAVRGTRAGGIVGPDLSHLMARTTLAAATVPNTVAYLSGWIADPQRMKPGCLMPTLEVSGPELMRIRRFLETLK